MIARLAGYDQAPVIGTAGLPERFRRGLRQERDAVTARYINAIHPANGCGAEPGTAKTSAFIRKPVFSVIRRTRL